MPNESKMFASLLKYWRGKRGLSQLDLALKADVSARHISFLETGRSQPSEEMVLRLTDTLDLPLRERNNMLREAGFADAFSEPELSALDDTGTRRVLELMMLQQEPYPLVVMDRWYNMVLANQAAQWFIGACFQERSAPMPEGPMNGVLALFQEELLRPNVLRWEDAARQMLARLNRELLHRPNDEKLSKLLQQAVTAPGVPEDWRRPDPFQGDWAVIPVGFQLNGETFDFITTLTVFSTPRNVTLQELQIESYFPLNEESDEAWKRVRGAQGS